MEKQLLNLIKIGKKNLEIIKISKSEFKNLDRKIDELVKKLLIELKKKKLFLAAMESCTSGGLINAITNIPGASEVIKGGLIAYSDQEKIVHGVPKKLIEKYTVYSPEVATAMAHQIIREIKGSQIGIGITGILSRPDPKYPSKKVGQANIAVIFKEKTLIKKIYFPPQKERKKAKAIIILKTLETIREIVK